MKRSKSVKPVAPKSSISFPITAGNARLLKKADAAGINRNQVINACIRRFALAALGAMSAASVEVPVNISDDVWRKLDVMVNAMAGQVDMDNRQTRDAIIDCALWAFLKG